MLFFYSDNIFYHSENFLRGPFKKIEDINIKIGTEISMLASYIRNDVNTKMKKVYQTLSYDDCQLFRKDLLVSEFFHYKILSNEINFPKCMSLTSKLGFTGTHSER